MLAYLAFPAKLPLLSIGLLFLFLLGWVLYKARR